MCCFYNLLLILYNVILITFAGIQEEKEKQETAKIPCERNILSLHAIQEVVLLNQRTFSAVFKVN